MWKYSSPWYTGFLGMALKTVLRQLLSKYGILSVELQTAINSDMAAINEDGSVDYVDNSADYETVQDAPQAPAADPATGEVIDNTPADEDPTKGFFAN